MNQYLKMLGACLIVVCTGNCQTTSSPGQNRMINPASVYQTTSRGFSQGIETTSRNLIFLSGIVGWDKNRNLPQDRSFVSEARQAIENIHLIMKAEKTRISDIVHLRFFVVDLSTERVREISKLMEKLFDRSHLPATTIVGISRLARPELNIEIEAIIAKR